jgi:hypothetical protein
VALIDNFAPEWQFREAQRFAVLAPADAVMRAVREVTAREIMVFRLLRRPPPGERVIDAALRRGFLELARSDRELVFGVIIPRAARPLEGPDEFLSLRAAGIAKAVINFRVEPSQLAMCVVRTETRVWTNDEKARRKFALYWWTIRLGSSLIRRMWLRAIRRRAEKIGS